jgi:AcrR family transcriptional regulator
MLEQPGAERITTAALAGKLDVSEAALYRHFASKAQMFEGLIEFIEQSVFTLANQINEREPLGRVQAQKILTVLLQFGEKNPGMTRVMVGDALVFENDRLLTAHEPVLRPHRVAAAPESAYRGGGRRLVHAHGGCQRPWHRCSPPSRWAVCSATRARASSATRRSISKQRCA